MSLIWSSKVSVSASRLLLPLVLLGLLACTAQPSSVAPAPVPAAAPPAPPSDNGQGSAIAKQDEARAKLAQHRQKKPTVVGGCGDQCQDPASAFRSFARRLLLPPEQAANLPPLAAFVDSSEMVYDGRRLGAQWVQLWKAGLVEQRAAEVQAFADELARRTGSATDPQMFLGKLDRPLDIQRLSSVDVTIVYAMPGTGALEEGEPWRFQLGKRGLEWLIRGVRSPLAPGGNDVLE
jgi:hypothetical protein